MSLMRLQEIMSELRAGGRLNADDWALICEMNALCMMSADKSRTDADKIADIRAKDRERKRFSRQNVRGHSMETPIILLDNNSEGGMGETKSGKSADKPPSRKPFDALAPVLGAELGRAIVEHRQKLRSPLTLKAAEMLAKRLQSFPDPKAAAEKMLERGWKSIDLDWGVNGLGPKKPKTGAVLQFRPEAPVISNDEWRKKREGSAP
jgi:hypothetical protein